MLAAMCAKSGPEVGIMCEDIGLVLIRRDLKVTADQTDPRISNLERRMSKVQCVGRIYSGGRESCGCQVGARPFQQLIAKIKMWQITFSGSHAPWVQWPAKA